MATSGKITKTVAFGNITLTLTQTKVDILKNCSYWSAVLTRYATSNIDSNTSKKTLITVNGKVVYNSTVIIGGSANKELATVTNIEIPHNDDGTKNFSFSFSQAIEINWGGSWIGTISGSATITADKISRASMINTVVGDMIGSKMTITINRNNANFKHELLYTFGNLKNQLIASNINTSHEFTLPLSICSQIPNATSGKITFVLRTYNGTSKVGSDTTKQVTINIPTSVVPVIESLEISEAIDNIASVFDAYIKDKSVLNVKINAKGTYGSTIKYYNASFLGVNYTGQTFQSNLITKSGELDITAKVTDSRGRTATFIKKVNVLDYFPPQASFLKVNRCLQDGTLNDKGAYARIEFSFAIAQLNNKNTKDIKIQWFNENQWETMKVYNDRYSATNEVYISVNEFNKDKAFMIRILCNDYFSSGENEKRLKATISTFNFNKNKNGLGIFTVSTKDGVQIGKHIFDMFDKRISNGLAVYQGGSAGTIDADTTTDTLILTDKNAPTSTLYFIVTFFYQDKTSTSNRSQIAIPYNHASGIYYRCFIDEKWSAWLK